jgi:hypothetical protein
MRDTDYAEELCEPSIIPFPSGSEGRIERLFIKKTRTEAIRFSWWKDGNLVPRPLDVTEEELLKLLADALAKGVFTPEFRNELKSLL